MLNTDLTYTVEPWLAIGVSYNFDDELFLQIFDLQNHNSQIMNKY